MSCQKGIFSYSQETFDDILHIMEVTFNKAFWEENLQYPDWYIRLAKELNEIFSPTAVDEESGMYRHKIYNLVGEMLRNSRIPLAEKGPDFDKERKPIDIVVVHHTNRDPNTTLETLSGIGLLRQYALDYLKNDVLGYKVYGQPIWSGHFRESKQVFFAYHWLVRPDGTVERLLKDKYIGWHAGNWDTNTRSVGIALSGNYTKSIPTETQLKAVKNLISQYYSPIKSKNIIGHCEASKRTICPGKKFLSFWKDQILP
jgi:hypothetical protein